MDNSDFEKIKSQNFKKVNLRLGIARRNGERTIDGRGRDYRAVEQG
jgi:hypothetical protein